MFPIANIKTTLLGVLTIIATVSGAAIRILNGQPVDPSAAAAAIIAGIGLIKASDAK